MYCGKCGAEVGGDDNFCPECGASLELRQSQPRRREQLDTGSREPMLVGTIARRPKSVGIALILAFLPGVFGILGLGHAYVGRWVTGFMLFLSGIVIAGASVGLAIAFVNYAERDRWETYQISWGEPGIGFLIGAGVATLIWLGLWIGQTIAAARACEHYNARCQ